MNLSLLDKYLAPGENWDLLCQRVSGLMQYRDDRELIYDDLVNLRWLPNSPCLVNGGRPGGRNLMACHALHVGNSIKEIFEAVKWTAMITKSGGGIGLEFSNLSPHGTPLKYAPQGVASGPVSFLRMFDTTAQVVMEGGLRRAAMLASLNANHPDILDFIECKETDGLLSNFNMTVTLDEGPDSIKPEVWDAIVKHAHYNGEPGIAFLDNINADNPVLAEFGPIKALNACQPGFATVLTPSGIRLLEDVDVGNAIWSGQQWTTISNKWCTGNRDVYRIITSRGEFLGTLDHKVFFRGRRIEAGDAESIDWCKGEYASQNIIFDGQRIIDGIVLGDGGVHKASDNKIYLCVGEKDHDYFESPISDYIGKANGISRPYSYDVKTDLLPSELPHTYLRVIPTRIFEGDRTTIVSFLRGLFSANGYVVSTVGRIGLKQSSLPLIKQVQQMLSSLGIGSYVTITKSQMQQFANGEYQVKEAYDLNITTDGTKFMDLIGFEQKYKKESYRRTSHGNPPRSGLVQSREYLGNFPVFEITVEDEDHSYWSGGLLISNCAEQPLYHAGSCVLASIVLPNVIEKLGYLSELFHTARRVTRFLNRVIDVNHYPMPEIAQSTRRTRDIGVGIMGFDTLLRRENIPYTSETALRIAEDIGESIRAGARYESIKLAKRDGGYLPGRRRNARLTTVAPTGHTSRIAGVSFSMYPELSDALKMTPEQHLDMVSAWQKHCDSSISYTVNISNDAPVSVVDACLRGAYERGIKVLSIYRDGSREGQPCTADSCDVSGDA